MAAKDELKKILKIHSQTKKDPVSVFVKIRETKDIVDLQLKDKENGIIEIRVHSTHEAFPKVYTHGYLIDISNLRLTKDDLKKMKQRDFQAIFDDPNRLVHADTKALLNKFIKDYGGVIPDGSHKLKYKTERYKKKKDPFKVKMKAM